MPADVLLLSFRYPPYSRVGAYRWTKLSHNLAELGHRVHVLTVDWPAMGETDWLAEARHPRIEIERLPSGYPHALKYRALPRFVGLARSAGLRLLNRGLGVMDEAERWDRALLPAAARVLARGPRVVIATGAPYNSNYWAGVIKQRHPEVQLIQDFRDPWFATAAELDRSRWKPRFEAAVRNADAVVAVTQPMVDLFRDLTARVRPESMDDVRFESIENGVEVALCASLRGAAAPVRDFVYTGALFNKREVPLTRFLEWSRRRRDAGRPVTTCVIGRYPDALVAEFSDLVSARLLEFRPTIPQREAFGEIVRSRFALQLNGPVGLANTQVTTKVIEHAALGVPTVSLNYGGVIEPFMKEHDLGWSVRGDSATFDAELAEIVDGAPRQFRLDVEQFDFRSTARRYATLIDELARA